MRAFFRHLLMAIAIAALAAQLSWAVDRIEEFGKARRSLQQQLRSKQASHRLEALKKLKEFPIADGARLIYNSLADPAEEVREAAYRTLLGLNDNQEVCDTLMLMAKKAVHQKDDGLTAAPLLAILLSSNVAPVERDTKAFLEKTAEAKNGLPIVLNLADVLGEHHDVIDVPPLAKLAKTKVFANQFAVRRAVVYALTKIPNKDAVEALIEMLDQLHGEVLADAVEYLTQVTEQIFGMESTVWQQWWKDAKDTFEYPAHFVRKPYRTAITSDTGYYYGLPMFAERLVFVLDTSGSMTGLRIAAAKRELTKAINSLPEHVSFGVVVFNGTVDVWHRQLVPATAQSKKAAVLYVNSQATRSNTASYDALEAAFGFDTEAIYFLSDGEPHGGKISAPSDIVVAITAANKARRISLYTIGIGAGFPGSQLDVFLKNLAEQNLGLYRRVDE